MHTITTIVEEYIKLYYSRTDLKQNKGGTFSLSKCLGGAVPLYAAVKLLISERDWKI